jgi:acyl-CoA thioesterase-1
MLKQYIAILGVFMILGSGCKSDNKQGAADNKNAAAKNDSLAKTVSTRTILFFGNSLTAGYGLDVSEAFPALIQAKIDSLKLPYKVINAGLSGETSAGGKNRIDWLLQQKIDVFVLELGANDGLRGIPVEETVKNLQEIIDRVKTKYPDAKLIMTGMQVPPNMGKSYADQFRGIFENLAKKNDMLLVPFILEGVGGVQELNQGDGIHPTAEGHRIVAENVWTVLRGIL